MADVQEAMLPRFCLLVSTLWERTPATLSMNSRVLFCEPISIILSRLLTGGADGYEVYH